MAAKQKSKLIYSARIDTLWMCAGVCGVAIGAAHRPLLSIHVVSGSVHREGLATRGIASMPEALLLGGGITANGHCV